MTKFHLDIEALKEKAMAIQKKQALEIISYIDNRFHISSDVKKEKTKGYKVLIDCVLNVAQNKKVPLKKATDLVFENQNNLQVEKNDETRLKGLFRAIDLSKKTKHHTLSAEQDGFSKGIDNLKEKMRTEKEGEFIDYIIFNDKWWNTSEVKNTMGEIDKTAYTKIIGVKVSRS